MPDAGQHFELIGRGDEILGAFGGDAAEISNPNADAQKNIPATATAGRGDARAKSCSSSWLMCASASK